MYGFFELIRDQPGADDRPGRGRPPGGRGRAVEDRPGLHDLLGHSLTTITVKAGLARRLAEVDPDRAAREIAEVEELPAARWPTSATRWPATGT